MSEDFQTREISEEQIWKTNMQVRMIDVKIIDITK